MIGEGFTLSGGRWKIATGRGWTMIRGDALDVVPELPCVVDALIADPPYSSGGFTRGDRMSDPSEKYRQSGATEIASFSGDSRDQRAYLAWGALWLRTVAAKLRKGAPACVWTDWRQLPITTDAFQAGGFVWRGVAVWTKCSASRPQMARFRNDAEYVVWGSLGPMAAVREVGVLPGSWSCPPVTSSKREHLTEKPVAVMEGVVAIARPGALVLDPFAGSGSTGVACLRQGRRFVGVEQDETYFERACERLRAEEAGIDVDAARAGQTSIFDTIGGER